MTQFSFDQARASLVQQYNNLNRATQDGRVITDIDFERRPPADTAHRNSRAIPEPLRSKTDDAKIGGGRDELFAGAGASASVHLENVDDSQINNNNNLLTENAMPTQLPNATVVKLRGVGGGTSED